MEVRESLLLIVRNGTDELVCRAANQEELNVWTKAVGKAIKCNLQKRAQAMETTRVAGGEVRYDDDDVLTFQSWSLASAVLSQTTLPALKCVCVFLRSAVCLRDGRKEAIASLFLRR